MILLLYNNACCLLYYRYIVGQLLENVKLKSFGKDMFELFYPKKLDGLIHVVQVSYQPKLQNLLEK